MSSGKPDGRSTLAERLGCGRPSDYGPKMGRNEWEAEIGREIEELSRAVFFVLRPEALVAVRDEMQRIRVGSGTDDQANADDYTSAVVDNARRLNARLAEMCRGLGEAATSELELFAAERLVEASLRYR